MNEYVFLKYALNLKKNSAENANKKGLIINIIASNYFHRSNG